jgi:creatinine amidohydrolase
MNAIDISSANWKDVKETRYDAVILPWGACEPHNYHLPYLTDCFLSHHIALESASLAYERSGVLCAVLPPVYFGSQNPGQWDLPLCIHTNSETQKAILSDVVESLQVQGFSKLVILNGQGGNTFKPYIRDLAKRQPGFTIIAVDWWTIVPTGDYFEERVDEHGGEQETSVLLHYRPDLVKLEQAGDGKPAPLPMESINQKVGWMPRHWQQVTSDTGIGNPKKSTAEKGKRYSRAVVEKIAGLLSELKTF